VWIMEAFLFVYKLPDFAGFFAAGWTSDIFFKKRVKSVCWVCVYNIW
jgi:hypothetical protein